MTHDELASSLAAHLRGGSNRVTWEDMQLGPSGSPRPDVYSMERTYTRLSFEAFECKVSVADFRADVTSGKWQSYLRFANSVTFAVPAGLIDKSQVPATAGLIICSEAGKWKYVKRPVRHVLTELPSQAWVKLLMDGVDRASEERRAIRFNEYLARDRLAKKFGADVGRMLYDLQDLPNRLQREIGLIDYQIGKAREKLDVINDELRTRRQRERDELDGRMRRLLQVLGVAEADVPEGEVRDVIQRVDRLINVLTNGEHRFRENPFHEAIGILERSVAHLRDVAAVLEPHPAEKT